MAGGGEWGTGEEGRFSLERKAARHGCARTKQGGDTEALLSLLSYQGLKTPRVPHACYDSDLRSRCPQESKQGSTEALHKELNKCGGLTLDILSPTFSLPNS